MYYADVLKLCGWEESELGQEKARLDEAFSILGLGPAELKHAEGWIKDNYDTELLGIRKGFLSIMTTPKSAGIFGSPRVPAKAVPKNCSSHTATGAPMSQPSRGT